MDYPLIIVPLSEEEGGGFLGFAPDLVGCMSDGESQQEAVANVRQAIDEWIETARRRGLSIPEPGSHAERERAYKEHVLTHLKALSTRVDSIETSIEELQKVVHDIEERLEHQDAWARFADLSALPVPIPEERHGHC